ncbi:MAG: SxtJ family membrane protein [Vicinamibacterales bacterium]
MRPLLRRMYAGWMTFARALAWVNARIILTVVFYLVLTPVGLARRLLGYDPMSRRLEGDAATYRVTREPRPSSHVEKQY